MDFSGPSASLWSATAEPAIDADPLAGDHRSDVTVVGGGFTGLATALALAEGGASVSLLEAKEPGFGASGRNGGQVIPGLKHDPDEIDQAFGEATTEFVGRSADTLFDLIERHSIRCSAERAGWIQASIKHAHLATLEKRAEQWQRRGARVSMLDAAGIARKTGAESLVGGWVDHRAGTVHPMNCARGLAAAAVSAGARIFSRSKALSVTRVGSKWRVSTDSGTADSDHVVIATNGYTGPLWPKLHATVLPANSFQVATRPLAPEMLARILPGRMAVSDTRRIGNYFRLSPDNRLVMGGRGSFRDPSRPEDFSGIVDAMHCFFPETKGILIDYRWSGRVAMTRDSLLHIHQPSPGVTMVLGYNGRGVALASAMGSAIAAHLLDSSRPLPLRTTEIEPLPVHGLHPWYGSAMIAWYRVRDGLER